MFERLEVIRQLFGYSQQELATKVHVTQQYYSKIVRGKKKSSKMSDLLEILKINESYLTSSNDEYPFSADFYTLCPAGENIDKDYALLVDYICAPSAYIDVVFILFECDGIKCPIKYIALKDDRDTIFLVKRHGRKRMFENIYFFCKRLSELPNTSVYERIQAVAEASCENIEKEASREDIFQYFPKAKYFRDQLDKRESTKKGVQPILSDANTDP